MSIRIALRLLALVLLSAAMIPVARAADTVKVAIGQIDAWANQAPTLGMRAGIFQKHGIVLETFGTQGAGETLQAVKSHSFVDVLSDPGANDLSAHVDFNSLGDAAMRGGSSVYGPVEQGSLLLSLGLRERAGALSNAARARSDIATLDVIRLAVERLVNADQMGRLFKALAIVPKSTPTPPGF